MSPMNQKVPEVAVAEPRPRERKAVPPAFNVIAYLETAGVTRRVVKLKRNALVFSQGDEADSVYYLQSGGVQLSVVSSSGPIRYGAGSATEAGATGLAGSPWSGAGHAARDKASRRGATVVVQDMTAPSISGVARCGRVWRWGASPARWRAR